MRIIKLAALVMAAGVAACLAAEVFLRLFYPQPLYAFERHLFQPDPDLGYRLTPHAVMTHTQPEYSYVIRANSFGFRGSEPDLNAQHRILVLGDSFAMGQGVGEGRNLCDVAQAELSAGGHDVDIFNTSMTAYFGGNQVSVLNRFAKPYDPDLVILVFYWNDIGVTESRRVVNGYLRLSGGSSQIRLHRELLNRHSHLFCLVKRYQYATVRRPWSGRPEAFAAGTSPDSAIRYIGQMQEICRSADADFRIVLLPYRGVLEDPPGRFREVKKTMIDAMTTQKIAFVDWAPLLPVNGARNLAYRYDPHWNDAGHRFFGRHLVDLVIHSLRLSDPQADAPSPEEA